MPEYISYYFTFGAGHPFGKFFIQIEVEKYHGEARAREIMQSIFGTKWAFCYGKDSFEGQIEEYGLTRLCHIYDCPHNGPQMIKQ